MMQQFLKYSFLSAVLLMSFVFLAACNNTAADGPQDDVDRFSDMPGEVINERIESEEHDFRLVRVVDGLEHPWAVTWLPDGRMLVTERPGSLQLIEGERRTSLSGLPDINVDGQGGLLDVQPHPDYASNGWIYFTYSSPCADGNTATALDRAKIEGDALVDRENLYTQEPCVSPGRHYGSRIVFPGDGTVLFSIGDRGQQNRAQDLSDPAGSVIRVNEDGSIPADNPFADQQDARPEIYSYGNRNIQGMTIQPGTGTIWAHEHGPQGGDELNIIEGGTNYGWPDVTYGVQYGSGERIGDEEGEGVEQPVIHWTPSIAPSGLAFYEGDAFPNWQGNLFVGALAFQQIRRLVLDGNEVTHQEVLLRNEIGRIRDVRQGPDDYIYLVTDMPDGGVYRIEPVDDSEEA